jgi:hypothetical protein
VPVNERVFVANLRFFDQTDKNRMVAAFVRVRQAAFERHERVRQHGNFAESEPIFDFIELVGSLRGETVRERFLSFG